MRYDYKKGTVWVGNDDEVHTFIIITEDSWFTDTDHRLRFVTLRKEFYPHLTPALRFNFTNGGLIESWFEGKLIPMPDKSLPALKAAVQEAFMTFQELEHSRRIQFKTNCELVGLWPVPKT